jgi:hypothetical protein
MSPTEETRQNLIPLSRQYATLAAAQADIANIPDGSATYVRSADGSSLADEYINNAGTLGLPGGKCHLRKLLATRNKTSISVEGVALFRNVSSSVIRTSNWTNAIQVHGRRTSDGRVLILSRCGLMELTILIA